MLFSSSGPLSVKDIQTAISRFHEQASGLPLTDEEPAVEAAEAVGADGAGDAAPVADGGDQPQAEAIAPVEDDEIYRDVPELVTTTQIQEAFTTISLELQAADSEVLLVEGHAGWRLVTHPRYARWVRLLRNDPPPVRLTTSALETLAVIAYRQPVTRAEIEQIRGVSAEAGLSKLLERDLVYVVGRADLPGRPTLYGTTDAFLAFVGIKSLNDLPSSDVLSPRQIDAWLQTSNAPANSSDAAMGLDETAEDQLSLDQAPVGATETPAVEPEPTSS